MQLCICLSTAGTAASRNAECHCSSRERLCGKRVGERLSGLFSYFVQCRLCVHVCMLGNVPPCARPGYGIIGPCQGMASLGQARVWHHWARLGELGSPYDHTTYQGRSKSVTFILLLCRCLLSTALSFTWAAVLF